MTERQNRLRILALQNQRRRTLEALVPKLQQTLGIEYDAKHITFIDEEELQQYRNRTLQCYDPSYESFWFHKEWGYDDRQSVESFCMTFGNSIGDIPVMLIIPELKTGILRIPLMEALRKPLDLIESIGSLDLYEQSTKSSFYLARHRYYFGNQFIEYKWEVDIEGETWIRTARQKRAGV